MVKDKKNKDKVKEPQTESPKLGTIPEYAIYKKTAAIEVYKVFRLLTYSAIFLMIAPLLTLAFNVAQPAAAYGLAAFIAICGGGVIVFAKKRMAALQQKYQFNPKVR
jgi:hypothetical protein